MLKRESQRIGARLIVALILRNASTLAMKECAVRRFNESLKIVADGMLSRSFCYGRR